MILHADLDAFYASVAQRDDPSLRGKPVVVSGSSRRAVVLTASYEARPYGIHSAMPLFMARERCPHLVVVPPTFDKYRTASKAVFEIYRTHAERVQGLSLDEAFLDVGDIGLDAAVTTARGLKDAVRAATSLAVSIGVASNKMVAKVACDDGKPDGLTAVAPGDERAYLADKPVGALWGVGPKTQARLRDRSIERCEQMAAMSDEEALALFGKWGLGLRDLARGIDDREVSSGDGDWTAGSISSESTFERDVTGVEAMIPIVREQAGELGERLRKRGLRAHTIGVKVKRGDFTVTGKQTSLAQPTDDPRVIAGAAIFCLRRAGVDDTPVRLVGVRVSTLVQASVKQISLFT